MARDIVGSFLQERNITRLYAPFLLVSFIFYHWPLLSLDRQPFLIDGPGLQYSLAFRIGYGIAFIFYLFALGSHYPLNRNFSLLCLLATWTLLIRMAYSWGSIKYEMATNQISWTIEMTWAFYLCFNTLLAAALLSVFRFPKKPESDES